MNWTRVISLKITLLLMLNYLCMSLELDRLYFLTADEYPYKSHWTIKLLSFKIGIYPRKRRTYKNLSRNRGAHSFATDTPVNIPLKSLPPVPNLNPLNCTRSKPSVIQTDTSRPTKTTSALINAVTVGIKCRIKSVQYYPLNTVPTLKIVNVHLTTYDRLMCWRLIRTTTGRILDRGQHHQWWLGLRW